MPLSQALNQLSRVIPGSFVAHRRLCLTMNDGLIFSIYFDSSRFGRNLYNIYTKIDAIFIPDHGVFMEPFLWEKPRPNLVDTQSADDIRKIVDDALYIRDHSANIRTVSDLIDRCGEWWMSTNTPLELKYFSFLYAWSGKYNDARKCVDQIRAAKQDLNGSLTQYVLPSSTLLSDAMEQGHDAVHLLFRRVIDGFCKDIHLPKSYGDSALKQRTESLGH